MAARQYDEIGLEVLLTQAGYLTIHKVRGNGFATLGYPNQEVATSLAQLYSTELLKGKALEAPDDPLVSEVLANATPHEVVELFNRVINAIDYQRFPITEESTCRAYLQVLLIGAALIPHVENHTALGRSDLEVEVGDRHWVFEIKFAKTQDEVPSLLQTAVTQVKERRYGQTLNNKKLLRVALVFNAQTRQFEAWEEIA